MRQRSFGFFFGPFGLGPELITSAGDRTFAAGQGNWAVVSGDDVTWDNNDCDWDCDELNKIRLAVTLTEGSLYKLQFDISAYTSGQIVCYMGGSSFSGVQESVDTFTLYLTAEAANWTQFAGSDFVGSIDNVSIKRVL